MYDKDECAIEVYHEAGKAYIHGATEALQSQWRSTKDELPNNGEQCVIRDKDGRIRAAIYCAVNRCWEMSMPSMVYIHKATTVVAWMPIPKYKQDKV